MPLRIQQNGQAVLARIPGLVEHIDGHPMDEFHFYSVMSEDPGLLGVSDHPRRQREMNALGSASVQRPVLHKRLTEFAKKLGIPVNFGHKLERLEQAEDSVTVAFANGVLETFSFVVGCDGLHSNTRSCLFGDTPADYTGVSQVRAITVTALRGANRPRHQWGGLSPTPEFWKGKRAPADLYGNGAHMIVVPVSDSLMTWA